MRRPLLPLALTLVLPLVSCGPREVPIVLPPPECPAGPPPLQPDLSSVAPCPSDPDLVCLTPDVSVDLGVYLREQRRWNELVTVCLASLEIK